MRASLKGSAEKALIAAVRFRAWALFRMFTAGSCAVIVSTDKKLLLVKPRYRVHWGLPGGFLQRHEQASEAMAREFNEEVGLPWEFGQQPTATYVQSQRQHLEHIFECLDVAIEPLAWRTSLEIQAVDWFPVTCLPCLQPEARETLNILKFDYATCTHPACEP